MRVWSHDRSNMDSSRGVISLHLPKMHMQASPLLFLIHQYFSIAFWIKSELFDHDFHIFLTGFPIYTTFSTHSGMLDASWGILLFHASVLCCALCLEFFPLGKLLFYLQETARASPPSPVNLALTFLPSSFHRNNHSFFSAPNTYTQLCRGGKIFLLLSHVQWLRAWKLNQQRAY